MKLKEIIINISSNHEWERIHNILKGKTNQKGSSEIEEALSELSSSQLNQIWKSLVQYTITNLFGLQTGELNQTNDSMQSDTLDGAEKERNLIAILFLSNIQVDVLSSDRNCTIPDSFLQFSVFIGSVLRDLEEPVKSPAITFCENWILKSFVGYEEIFANTLILLIGESLQKKAKKQSVKRIWALRSGFSFLFSCCGTDATHPINELLLSCVESSLYLTCDEGIKILSQIMNCPALTKQLHEVVKYALPDCSKDQSEKYAEIYFRTWKQSSDNLKKVLEEDCLQDIMYHAVHVNRDFPPLTDNIFHFMSYIHRQKRHLPTASMICDLYEPFLWRSLHVPNPVARLNAATILCDAFPLSHTSHTQEEKESLMERQYKAFVDLLADPSHLVRIATIKGVFNILSNFWLVVPAHIIQKIFKICLSRLMDDASSAEVVVQVIEGMTLLLDVAEAGPFMTDVLPRLTDALEDNTVSVRLAYVKLLHKVKQVRITKFWDLIPYEHLLHVIRDDPPIRSTTIQLIQSSFLPLHLDEKEMLYCCISLLKMDRMAARWFYQQASGSLDIETTSRFILLIWRTISRYVSSSSSGLAASSTSDTTVDGDVQYSRRAKRTPQPNKGRKSRKVTKDRNKENKVPSSAPLPESPKDTSKDNDSAVMPLDNPEIVLGLLDTIVVLWTSNFHKLSLPENLKYTDGLKTRLAKTFPAVWRFFKDDSDIASTLLYLSSFLPRNLVPTMAGLCLSQIKSIVDPDIHEDQFTSQINALCNWNRVDDILELVTDWLEKAFESTEISECLQKKKKKKKVGFSEKSSANPLLGLRFIVHLLDHPLNKLCLLHKNRPLVIQLCDVMARVKPLLLSRITKGSALSSLCSDKFLISCWKNYLLVAMLLGRVETPTASMNRTNDTQMQDFDTLRTFNETLNWFKSNFLGGEKASSLDSPFALDLTAILLKMFSNFVGIGYADLPFVSDLLVLNENVLQNCSYHSGVCISAIDAVRECHLYLTYYSNEESHLLPEGPTIRGSSLCLNFISDCEDKKKLQNNDLVQLVGELQSLWQAFFSRDSIGTVSGRISVIWVDRVISLIGEQLKKDPTSVSEFRSLKELNDDAKVLLMSIQKKAPLITSFMKALQNGLSNVKFDICGIASSLILLRILRKDKEKLPLSAWRNTLSSAEELLQRVVDSSSRDDENEDSSIESEHAQQMIFIQFCSDTAKSLMAELKESN